MHTHKRFTHATGRMPTRANGKAANEQQLVKWKMRINLNVAKGMQIASDRDRGKKKQAATTICDCVYRAKSWRARKS